jgi:multisubunit Na+/H+ antiporter MnhC subunit
MGLSIITSAIVLFLALEGWFTIGPQPEPAAGEPAASPPFTKYEVTAEFVLWLMLIATNVQARGEENVNRPGMR